MNITQKSSRASALMTFHHLKQLRIFYILCVCTLEECLDEVIRSNLFELWGLLFTTYVQAPDVLAPWGCNFVVRDQLSPKFSGTFQFTINKQ